MPFSFSHRKATQALNFFARKAGGRINKMKALKLERDKQVGSYIVHATE